MLQVPKGWKIAGGVAAGLMVFGLLALRYGGQIIAPFLPEPTRRIDTATTTASATGDSTLSAPVDSGLVITHGPFVVAGTSYNIRVERDTGVEKGHLAARRVQVTDSNGRTVYDENIYLRFDSTAAAAYVEFHPSLLEDASGRPRGFQFSYAWFPSTEGVGIPFHIVAPRGDALTVLTPALISYYGEVQGLPPGDTPRSGRLLPGDQLLVTSKRGWFDATIPLRINFDCRAGSTDCVRVDLKDSIAGLARFEARASHREKVDTAVTLEVFNTPRAPTGERIIVPAGQEAEILGGAGRVFFESTPNLFLSGENEWLEIRVNGRRYWITGQESFRAIGLMQVG